MKFPTKNSLRCEFEKERSKSPKLESKNFKSVMNDHIKLKYNK